MLRHGLIVEDDPLTRSLLAQAFGPPGHQPLIVTSADALRAARAHRPHFVVTGRPARRPGATDPVAALRLSPDTWHLPIVRVAPATSPPAGLEVAADEHVPLPFRAEDLHKAIHLALGHAAERQRCGTRAEACFHLRSDPRLLQKLHKLIAELFHSAGLSILQVQKLTLAARELAANSIEWGHQNQAHRVVTIVCRIDADKVAVVVRDTGPGFDRRHLPHAANGSDPIAHLPVRAARNLRDGGFGILMASGLVDELHYNDAGNEARLVCYFAAPPCGATSVAPAPVPVKSAQS
jgi:anti-sigma regulatory factor (Ser/Thr protein kinase)